jgi:hypothetical protein
LPSNKKLFPKPPSKLWRKFVLAFSVVIKILKKGQNMLERFGNLIGFWSRDYCLILQF